MKEMRLLAHIGDIQNSMKENLFGKSQFIPALACRLRPHIGDYRKFQLKVKLILVANQYDSAIQY